MVSLTKLLLSLALSFTVASSTNVLLPLYIYPTDESWAPIYSAATNHPNLGFEVVINPNSGKPDSAPDAGYAAGVRNLKSHPNIEAIGYIATGTTVDNNGNIIDDRRLTAKQYIANYSTWPVESRPTGIFFDEVTRTSTADVAIYRDLVDYTRSRGFTGTIIFNSGAIPQDPEFFNLATQVVAFEGCYNTCDPSANYQGVREQQVANLQQPGPKVDIIIHHMPLDNTFLSNLVSTFKSRNYGAVYLTDDPATYAQFGQDWNTFVDLMAA